MSTPQQSKTFPDAAKRHKRYLTAKQVRERYGDVSFMWIERRLKGDPDFPRYVKRGRLRFWDEDALDEWDCLCAARGRCGNGY